MFGSFFKKTKGNSTQTSSRDPGCGMQAKSGIAYTYNGETYAFCSGHCKAQFEKNPETYIVK